jgi:predicted permease
VKRSFAERVYAMLLWAHPPAFRRACGADILQVVRSAAKDATRADVILMAGRDGLSSLAREWTAAFRKRPGQLGAPPPSPGEPMRTLFRDLALAARLLIKAPVFTVAAVATLALGIGANTAMFTLADATLLRPLPFHDPQQLVVWSWSSAWPHYQEYAKRTDIFEGVLASGGVTRLNVAVDGSTELVQGAYLSGNAFDVLGVRPVAGRTLLPSDDVSGGPIVAVLNHGYWRSRFGGDESVIGRTLRVNGRPMTIIGVAEPDFRGISLGSSPSLYLPAAASGPLSTGFFSKVDRMTSTGFVWLTVVGRLRPDVTASQASEAMDALYTQLQPPKPGTTREERLQLEPLETRALGSGAADVRTFVHLLLGVVGLTLLIGCANLANLLLAKAAARRREMGVRLALGATRARIVQQLLVESLLLAVVGGAAGLLVASLALQALAGFELPGGLRVATIPLDLSRTALAVTFGLSLLTGLLFGAAPAWRASRTDVLVSLRDQSRGATRRGGIRNTLLAAQVAMSLMLLIGAGLFGRSLVAALDSRLGFQPAQVASATVNLGTARYDAPRAAVFYQTVLERVQALPQVAHASWTNLLPTRGAFMWNTEIESTGKSITVYSAHVGPEHFATLGTRLIAGRPFAPSDTAASDRVAIVNELMAREYFGERAPIGSRLKVFNTWVTIVGVAENTIVEELREEPAAQIYLAFDQWLDGPQGIGTDTAHLFVKGTGDMDALLPLLREQLRAADPEAPVYALASFDETLETLTMPQRLGVTLFALFSAIALALATIGIYGVATYVAALRTREIGVRMALGATRSTVRRLILQQSAWPIAAGILVGFAGALYTSRAAHAFLVDISPVDPVTFALVPLFLALVGLAATYLPARRASRIEPVAALRDE